MMSTVILALALLLQLPGAAPPPPPPLRPATGAVPDTVTVGDRFRSAIRLDLPPGSRVAFPAFPTSDTLQQVDSVAVRADSAGAVTAVYPLVAWVAGITPAAVVRAEVLLPDGQRATYRIALRLPFVRSVLPADTAGLRPKPPKGLVSIPLVREWWRLLLLALALLAALGVIFWLYRSLRRGRTTFLDPRAEALARLDEIGARADADGSDAREFYTAVVRVLRVYLAALDPRWGEHLTSRELLGALAESGVARDRRARLERLLQEADPARFGPDRTGVEHARPFLAEARTLVEAGVQ
jgi:hypothetical protein